MKILPFKVPKTKNETILYQKDEEPVLYDKLHQHEEIQISFIEAGEGTLIVGNSILEFRKGDILVFGSNLPHVFRSEFYENALNIVHSVFFDSKTIEESLSRLPECKDLGLFFESTKNGLRVLDKKEKIIKTLLKIAKVKNMDKMILFLKLLKQISKAASVPLSSYRYEKNLNDHEEKRMQVVLDYVMNHFDKKITLEEVADLANLSKNSFCRYFKVRTNKTFFQFLIELRVEKAARLLVSDRNLSIIEIAELSGFTNISNFNRQFKEIKKTAPLQYKKQMG